MVGGGFGHSGSWFGLPDFGITESIGRAVSGGTRNEIIPNKQPQATYNPPQVQGASTQSIPLSWTIVPNKQVTTNNTGSNNNIPSSATSNQGYSNINQQQENGNQQIENDYNQAMQSAADAESSLNRQGSTATAQIANDLSAGKTDLATAQATGEQAATSSLQTGEKNYTTNMQQARDLFRQTQQSNSAQLSALGLSSSSVTEALAEKLGVDVARRIAGATGTIQEIRQNATDEIGRVRKYYAEKTTQLEENARIQKETIQSKLVDGLNQINAMRGQAASAKSEARASLLSQVQTSLYNLTLQQQQFEQQLKQWAEQKAATLTPLTQEQFLKQMEATLAAQQAQYPSTDYTLTPTTNIDAYGKMSGQIDVKSKKEDTTNPFAT